MFRALLYFLQKLLRCPELHSIFHSIKDVRCYGLISQSVALLMRLNILDTKHFPSNVTFSL
jgi:hypothetical protein